MALYTSRLFYINSIEDLIGSHRIPNDGLVSVQNRDGGLLVRGEQNLTV